MVLSTLLLTDCTTVADAGDVLLCANAGDSRAVGSQRGTAVRISVDHRADDESEIARIEAAGGSVEFGRLEGELQVSRGFGDFCLEPGLTPEPFVAVLGVREYDFIILASDGVWDKVEDQEAVTLVAEAFIAGASAESAAAELAAYAAEMRSTDDIGVVVVRMAKG